MPDPPGTIHGSPQHTATTAYAASAEKVHALCQPQTYGHVAQSIELIETHFAWVFLVGEYAYKLKKPVRAAGLDLTEAHNRYQNCCEELRLNRRLAPEIYLGLKPLTRAVDGSLHVGGEGAVVDWLIQMKRLPAALMLDRALASGTASRHALVSLGRLLTDFYRRQPAIDMTPRAYVERIAQQIDANEIDLLAPDLGIDSGQVTDVVAVQRDEFKRLAGQLAERATQRRIVEAHGDLRPEHVYLGTPPCVIDCLEFSFELRVQDPCEELAYLTVETRLLGAAWAGEAVFQTYQELSRDPLTPELFRFYQSHRAATRAKVVVWHLRDPEFTARQPWSSIAGRYLETARLAIE